MEPLPEYPQKPGAQGFPPHEAHTVLTHPAVLGRAKEHTCVQASRQRDRGRGRGESPADSPPTAEPDAGSAS